MTMMSALWGCLMGRISPGLCGLGMHDRYIEENWKEEFINDLLISSTWDLSRTF